VQLSSLGRLVDELWQETSTIRPNVHLDAYVIMPNHIHAIVFVPEQLSSSAPRRRLHRDSASLSSLVAGYKSAVTSRARSAGFTTNTVWQRGFFEHVIRDDAQLERARTYIFENPMRWGTRCVPLPG